MKVTAETKSGPFNFECGVDEMLLYAGLRHGLTLPYECATGTCGTCRARVVAGSVAIDWDDAPGFAKLRRDKGDILLCQARPREDCVLRVPANVLPQPERHAVPLLRTGTILNVRRLTPDVIHFEVGLAAPMTFDAGQFVVLKVPGLNGARAYSMVNFQRDCSRIDLVIKRKHGGGFGNWLFDREIGSDQIEIFGPLGRATFHPEEDRDLLMIAGGSGIAGLMAILERATEEDYFRNHKGFVFFGVRSMADGFYLEEMSRFVADGHENLEVTLALSHEAVPSATHPAYSGVRLATGMVHEVMANSMRERYTNVAAFIAGPPPMVDGAIRALITEGGLSPALIRYDKFG